MKIKCQRKYFFFTKFQPINWLRTVMYIDEEREKKPEALKLREFELHK